MCEANEINADDLEAAVEYFRQLSTKSLPQHEACKIAQQKFGISIQGTDHLDRILMTFANSSSSLENCVNARLLYAGYQSLVQ